MRRVRLRGSGDRGDCGGDDRGAIAVLVAVLLSGSVLLGLGAIVIDAGLLAAEREQLQSGADAGSWAVAQNCMAEPADCTDSVQGPVAAGYAEGNSNDALTDATVCPDTACQPAMSPLFGCPTLAMPPLYSVEVRTTTRNQDGSTLLPPRFSAAIGGGNTGTTVNACARVGWSPYPEGEARMVFALGISLCDWVRGTRDKGYFRVASVLDAADVTRLAQLDEPDAASSQSIVPRLPLLRCDQDVIDSTPPAPSGWAWLGVPDGSCQISVAAPVTLNAGLPVGTACCDKLAEARDRNAALLVPIYDSATAVTYHVVGYAAFAVTQVDCLINVDGYFSKTFAAVGRPDFGTPTADLGTYVLGRTG
jgi:hypothetical protein